MKTHFNDGGPAFASAMPANGSSYYTEKQQVGMSLRDYFARNTPQDEVCEMTYKHLSLLAQERLAGMKRPEINRELRGEDVIEQQIAIMIFHARVTAALRYISADAMIAARKESNF